MNQTLDSEFVPGIGMNEHQNFCKNLQDRRIGMKLA